VKKIFNLAIAEVAASLFLVFPVFSQGQLHDCNGVWTNKPCESIKEQKPVSRKVKETIVAEAWRLKQEMLQKGINFPAEQIEAVCYRETPPTSDDECRQAFERHKEMVENELAVRELRAQ